MSSTIGLDVNAVMNEYAKDEIDKWQYIKYYPYENCLPHHLLPLEKENSFVAKFSSTHAFNGCFDNTGNEIKEISPEKCRYFKIGDTVFDMYDPESIMEIPFPEIIAFDFATVPDWYIDKYRKRYNIPEEDDAEVEFLSKREIDALMDRATHLHKGQLT